MQTQPVKVPTKQTLAKYGLSEAEWLAILEHQGGVCYICEKVPGTGRMVTDHEHVKGFKKMEPQDKKKHVRGLCCWTCNRYFLARGMTITKALRVAQYLREYEARRG